MKPIKDTTKQMEEKQVCVNPSYDKSLPIEKRLADFLGKYHIIYNGSQAHEPFMLKYEGKPNDRCDTDIKKEIIEYVSPLFASEKRRLLQEIEEEVKKRRKNLAIIITADGKEAMTVDEWQTKGYNTAMDEIKKIISSMK